MKEEWIWSKGTLSQPEGGDSCSALHKPLPGSSTWVKGKFLMCSTSQLASLAKSHSWLFLSKTCWKLPPPCCPARRAWRARLLDLWNSISTDLWAGLTLYFKMYFYLKLLIWYFWHSEDTFFTGWGFFTITENSVSHLSHMSVIHPWNCLDWLPKLRGLPLINYSYNIRKHTTLE